MTSPNDSDLGARRLQTSSGIPIERVYSEPMSEANYSRRLGDPGEYPYTRGIRQGMYSGRSWTIRQYAGFGTAKETNERFRYLLAQGQTGLSVAFDLPTQMGFDSDHPLAEGEVGRVGVAIDTIQDMRQVFHQIPLGSVSTSMTINSTAAILLAMYVVVAEEQGVGLSDLRGTVQNDMLKEFVARGTQIYPPSPSLRLVADIIEHCRTHLPRWKAISISGYHIREAGATAVEELAFTLGNAVAYVEAVLARGLCIDEFAPQLSFFFAVHNEFLEEVAKLRAARRMWARITRDRFGAESPRSMMMRFHAQTAGSTLTAQFPDGNIVRTSLQTLAAVLGGAQSIHTNSRDEAQAIPREESARLALRTQQVIAEESGLRSVDDPAGGAFALETLTDEIEDEAVRLLNRIEAMGGMLAAIESGYVQQHIEDSAYRAAREIARGDRVVVGVNRFVSTEDNRGNLRLHVSDPALEAEQIARLGSVRTSRDGTAVQKSLERVGEIARSGANLMPAIIDAVRSTASVGEISEVLEKAFGPYRDTARTGRR